MPDCAIAILSAGGGLRISAKGLMPDTLTRYAQAAAKGGGRLEVVMADGATLLPVTLEKLASAGAGAVLFDFVTGQG